MMHVIQRLTSQLSTRERNILILAALIALVFLFRLVIPAIGDVYRQRENNIDSVLLELAREERLIENTQRWRERRTEAEARRNELEGQIFSGATIPLMEAAIQRDLTQYARNTGIEVNSTRLAERLQTTGWLMISQEMSFRTADAANTIDFLEALENSSPRLFVRDFSLDRNRALYSGSITVVGFARSQGFTTGPVAGVR